MVRRVEHPITYDAEAAVVVALADESPHTEKVLNAWIDAIDQAGDYPNVTMAGFSARTGLQEAVDSRVAESIGTCAGTGVCEAEVKLEGVDGPSHVRKFVGTCVIRNFSVKEDAEERERSCQTHLDNVFPKVIERAAATTNTLAKAELAVKQAQEDLRQAQQAI